MRVTIALFTIAATTAASAAVAMQAQSTGAGASARDQLVCKNEAKTGSRFGRRSCISRAEQEARAQHHQREMDDIRGRTLNKEFENPKCNLPPC